jgi:hypothetical protein
MKSEFKEGPGSSRAGREVLGLWSGGSRVHFWLEDSGEATWGSTGRGP